MKPPNHLASPTSRSPLPPAAGERGKFLSKSLIEGKKLKWERQRPIELREGEIREEVLEERRLKNEQAYDDRFQAKRWPPQQEEGKLIDARVIHESVGRDLKCNSCEHHVPRSVKHSILCRKYLPHGPPGTRLYRCFTSCPNCFEEWELWPNNRYADSFDVLSGATYQENVPEPNPDFNLWQI